MRSRSLIGRARAFLKHCLEVSRDAAPPGLGQESGHRAEQRYPALFTIASPRIYVSASKKTHKRLRAFAQFGRVSRG